MADGKSKIFNQDLDDVSNKSGDLIFSFLAVAAVLIDYNAGYFNEGSEMIMFVVAALSVVISLWQATNIWNVNKRNVLLTVLYMSLLITVLVFALPVGSLYGVIVLQLIYQSHYWFGYRGSLSILGLFSLAVAGSVVYSYDEWQLSVFADAFRLIVMVILSSLAIMGIHDLAKKRILEERNARKQMENEKRRLTALMNSMSDAVVATDHEGIIVEYNNVAEKMLDSIYDMHNKTFSEAFNIHNASGEQVDLIAQTRNSKKQVERDDLFHIYKSKRRIQLNVVATPVQLPSAREGVFGYTLVMRDITKSKSIEEQRSDFITTVSREFITPSEVLEDSLDKVHKKEGDHDVLVNAAQDNSHYINRLIGDLNILAMIEQDRHAIDIRAFEVRDVLDYLYERYRPIVEARGNEFKYTKDDEVDHVVSNQAYVTEILSSLISNAIKNTKNGQIVITAERLPSAHIIIRVIDSGIGMTKSELSRVFDKFYETSEESEREPGAAGFGLYVSKKLAEQIGAQITVKTEINKGSTFALMIPPEPGIQA